MANTYKNIVITPNIDAAANVVPVIRFSGGDITTNTDINLRVYTTQSGTLSFEGSAGQLFSITNDLTNSIFSVNDVSGIPSIDVNANGLIQLARYGGNVSVDGSTLFIDGTSSEVGIGTYSPTANLHVIGTANITSTLTIGTINAADAIGSSFNKANTANANFTAANILSNLLTVDGTGSLLDADTLDGWHQSELGGKQLASASVGTGTTVDYSWVSAGTINWSGPAPVYLSAVLRGLSHGAATSQPLRIEFSDDKGVTFTTAINISPPIAASTALNGHVLIYRPSATTATKVIVWNTSPQDRSSSNVGTWELPAAGGTAALSNVRFGFASGNFDAGAVYVYAFT